MDPRCIADRIADRRIARQMRNPRAAGHKAAAARWEDAHKLLDDLHIPALLVEWAKLMGPGGAELNPEDWPTWPRYRDLARKMAEHIKTKADGEKFYGPVVRGLTQLKKGDDEASGLAYKDLAGVAAALKLIMEERTSKGTHAWINPPDPTASDEWAKLLGAVKLSHVTAIRTLNQAVGLVEKAFELHEKAQGDPKMIEMAHVEFEKAVHLLSLVKELSGLETQWSRLQSPAIRADENAYGIKL